MKNLHQIILESFGLEESCPISDKTKYGELPGWDSIGAISLLREIEKQYSIQLSLEEIGSVRSIGDIRALINKKSNRCVD